MSSPATTIPHGEGNLDQGLSRRPIDDTADVPVVGDLSDFAEEPIAFTSNSSVHTSLLIHAALLHPVHRVLAWSRNQATVVATASCNGVAA